jgi:hypothetical protein
LLYNSSYLVNFKSVAISNYRLICESIFILKYSNMFNKNGR